MLKTAYSVALATAILASSGAAFAAERYEITDYERVLIAPTPCEETKANAVENLTIDVPVAVVQPRS